MRQFMLCASTRTALLLFEHVSRFISSGVIWVFLTYMLGRIEVRHVLRAATFSLILNTLLSLFRAILITTLVTPRLLFLATFTSFWTSLSLS